MDTQRKINQSKHRHTVTRHLGLASLVLAGSLAGANAHAAALYVQPTGLDIGNCLFMPTPCRTIAYAISRASVGDTINLKSTALTFEEHGINIPFDLTISGVSENDSIIDGLSLGGVFDITGGNVVIENVTIQNGDAGLGSGGGINVQAGSLTLDNSTLIDNRATGGGGIAAHGDVDEVLVLNSKIRDNVSTSNGGGISCQDCGSLKVRFSGVSDNYASDDGGAIFASEGDARISNTNIKRNSAYSGGGIYIEGGINNINSSDLSDNVATDSVGGGVSVDDGDLNVFKTVMAGNIAQSNTGGAINMTGYGVLNVSSSTFTSNEAVLGGALYLVPDITAGATVLLNSSTFYANYSNLIAAHIGGLWATFTMNNTIIANDPSLYLASPACGTAPFAGEHNLIDDASCIGSSASFDLGAVTDLDLNLARNGGLTRTHKLDAGSNAIDTGLNSVCNNVLTGAALNEDQRGLARPVDATLTGVAICDIGAFEVQ